MDRDFTWRGGRCRRHPGRLARVGQVSAVGDHADLGRAGCGVLIFLVAGHRRRTPAVGNGRSGPAATSARVTSGSVHTQLPRFAPEPEPGDHGANDAGPDPWAGAGTRPGHGAADALGVCVLLRNHGLDLLPARLAGRADGQPTSPTNRHHGGDDGVRATGTDAQLRDERLAGVCALPSRPRSIR